MAISTSALLAELIPNEVIQESRLAFQKDAMLPQYVRVADLSGRPGKAAEFARHVAVTVTKDSNESTDQTTIASMDPTSVTLTVARRVARIDITDLAAESTVEDVNITAGRILGKARAKQVDTDLLGVMTTNWTSSVGATNSTAITPENILSALLTLKTNEADDNLMLAIHPKQEIHLLDDLVVTSSTDSDSSALGQSAVSDGRLGGKTLFGFKVFSTPRVGTGSDTADIYTGLAFNADCLGYAVKNIGAAVEAQRDASSGLTELVMNYYDSCAVISAAAFVLVKSQTY